MNDCLINGIKKVDGENLISFHMPGHKNNKEFFNKYLNAIDLIDMDLTEIPGTDNLHDPENIIKQSQIKLSKCYKSLKSYFLVNGSTSGILSMIFAVTKRNDKILINRNAHKSAMNAIILNDLDPIYIIPKIDKENGLILGIDNEELEEILIKEKDIKVVFLTYPTYEGFCFDIEKTIKIVKKYNKLLVIDEAHGSHFIMNDEFPMSSIDFGADVVVQSAHKNLPAFTQGAYLHVNNNELVGNVEKYLKIFQSSSPSYLIMSSLDASVDFILKEGKEKSDILIKNIKSFYEKMKKSNYKLLNMGILDNRTVYDYDISKIVISPLNIGITGQELEKILRNEYKIQIEYSTYNFCLFIATVFNNKSDFNKLFYSLLDIEKKYKKEKLISKEGLILKKIITKIRIGEIDKYDFELINLEKSLNRISYESVVPYPPGIPLINPGEVITKEALLKIKEIRNNIKVLKEKK